MASVYRGRDLRLNREVAVKILRDDLTRDPQFLARFQREAQTVASLSHPHIVPVYDVGEEDGTHFIVMEYVRGRTLRDTIERDGTLDESRATSIMLTILDALGHAHAQGLIHRDVKPQNILLTPDETPRLADFGIAHLADGSSTRTAAILGSAEYLSPEQSRGEEATVRSDVYACGIVLYEMLTGRPPFQGPNALSVAHQHLNTVPPPLHETRPDIDRRIEQAVMRALAKDPSDRFEGTAQFAESIRPDAQNSDQTSVQPLMRGPGTAVQHGRADANTSFQPLAHRAPQGEHLAVAASRSRQVIERRIVIRRSTRRLYALVAGIVAILVAAAYVASLPVLADRLRYPSAPYAAAPALCAAYVAFAWLYARSWLYTLDRDAAVIQWGVISHHRLGVPIRTVVSLELKQSVIDRLLGVGTVDLCARDEQGSVRHLIMEDVPHPKKQYEALLRLLSWAARSDPPADE